MSQIPLLPGVVYHVYTHANGFENIFNCEENFRYFLKKYAEYIYPVAETYAYCLMPNHIHFMIKIRSEREIIEFLKLKKLNKLKDTEFEESVAEEPTLQGFKTLGEFSITISRQFSHLFNGYIQAYNKMYNRKGSLFIPNFKRKEINNETYMSQLMAYIHNNPVHHGFTKQAIDWPYSSFQTYISEKSTNLNRDFMYEWFESKGQFIAFHKNSFVPYKLLLDE